ncbi:MAG: alpha-amylase family glycosyl hydrolase [Halanaerobiales bacterium]
MLIFGFYGNGNDENHLNFNFEIIKAAVGDRWYDGDTSPDSDKYIDLDTGYLVHNLREALDKYNIMFKQLGYWPTMALGNHDQPRVFSVFSEFVSDKYRDDIAKIVAGLTLLSKGTPFLYYGEEIGMENMEFDNLSDLKDTFGVRYCEYLIDNGVSEERALAITNQFSRDMCRTPMQWSNNINAGFSENDNTWLKVNPNFTDKNVEKQLADDGSILNFYRKLIEIRKTYNSFCSGDLIWVDDRSKDYLAFLRKGMEESVLVVLNFSESKQIVRVNYSNGDIGDSSIELLLSNYRRNKRIFQKDIKINPIEIFVGKLN